MSSVLGDTALTRWLGDTRGRGGTVRVLTIIAVGAVAVGVGVGLLIVGIVNQRSGSERTLRTSSLLTQVITVERSVVDAETGLRGYVITASPVLLDPLSAARKAMPRELAALGRAARRNRDHVGPAAALSATARLFMSTYVPRVLALMRSDPSAARTLSVTLAGKQRVDAVRNRAGRLERALSAELASEQRDVNSTANDDITYGVTVLVVLVLLTLVIESVLGRLLLTRGRALRRSRENARMLQTSLLPLVVPEIPGCDLAIRFTPAGFGELVGGDFYDVYMLDSPNRWAVVVGDVCGKGAEAAATTAVARWTLRSASLLTPTPADALQHLNEVMRRRAQRFLFATIAYLLIELRADEARITVTCAGHPPPIVLGPDRPAAPESAHGDLVGIWPRLRLHTSEVTLRKGDMIVAYTDGATDFSADPVDPLDKFLRETGERDAASVAAAVEARAIAGRPAPRDDIAVVAVQFHGQAIPLGEAQAADSPGLAREVSGADGAVPAADAGAGHAPLGASSPPRANGRGRAGARLA